MVHRSPTNEQEMAIVSVLFDSGLDLNNDFMLELDPRTTNINQPRKTVSFASKLFDNFYGNFFHYNGSMTYPPCSENVRWFIFSVPVQISTFYETQMFNLVGSGSYIGNYRNLQNLNGREVQLVSKIYWKQYRYMRPFNNEMSSAMSGVSFVMLGLLMLLAILVIV